MQKNIGIKTFLILTLCGMVQFGNALVIVANKNIDLHQKEGKLSGNVVFNNKVYPALATGNYKFSTDRKNVAFIINQIKTNGQTYNLQSFPSVIKEAKSAKRLPKGSKLVLAGENQEEIAKILGLDTESYKKKGSGIATGATITSGSSANSGSTQGATSGGSGGSDPTQNPFSSSTTSGNDFGISGGNYYPSSGSSGSNGLNNPVIVPSGNDSSNSGDTTTYSSQYCKAPQSDGINSISLSIVDKDGNCVPLKAQRDDTKCEYRYDFNDGVAIKQTQFYYVDKENQTQNIGGCVDLQGDEYRFPLYKDDSKCKLQVTKDKGYGGGQSWMFQTQILFRGADGLIHMAADCGDYMNVQEELISYDKDSANKQLKRVVNQYYIDPTTGQKVFINNGIISPFKFPYQEFTCGAWEMDDANLEASIRTQIKAYDNVANKYIDITSCDYSNDEGKTGRITQPYIKLPNKENDGGIDEGDMNGTYTFEFKQALYGTGTDQVWADCKGWCSGKHTNYTYYFLNGFKTTQWKTTYKTTNTGVTTGYQRPKQEWENEPSIYYTSKRIKTIDRTTSVIQNDLNLDANYMKFYEVNENYYKEESIKTTPEFTSFVSKYYKPGAGFCEAYSISGGRVGDSPNYTGGWRDNVNIDCSKKSNYILP